VLLGIPLGRHATFVYGALTHYGGPSQILRLADAFSYSLPGRQPGPSGPTTPTLQRLPAITQCWFSLFRFRSPLLTESLLFSLPEGNEMFHFPSFPPRTLCVQVRATGHDPCWVSPFGDPRITARLTAPRGLSQPPTSFIGSWCQDIHRAPLKTWPQRCSRPLCSSQTTNGNHQAPRHHTPPPRPRRNPAPEPSDGPAAREASKLAPSGPNSAPSHPPPTATSFTSRPPKEPARY
jgi:hypothetical protein